MGACEIRTLVELLERSCERHGHRPALSFRGESSEPWSWSYAELWEMAQRAATFLRSVGVGKSDRVILWGPNRPEWVAAFFGIQVIGATAVPLDIRSREDLLTRIETQTATKHLIIGRHQAADLHETHAPCTILEELRGLLESVEPLAADHEAVSPDDIAELNFTSGTTGDPKGVVLTHRNISADVKMALTAIRPTPGHRTLSVLPLSHMLEQTTGLHMPLSGGASITYLGSLRPDAIFEAMSQGHITNMSCVPQVLALFREGIERQIRRQGRTRQFERLHALARRLPMRARRLLFRQVHRRLGAAFEFFVVAGAYLDPELARWWEGLGIKVVQGYGMTEASPAVTSDTLREREATAVGRPLPGIDVRIAEDSEIWIRGENVTPGYWQNPDASAEAFSDGWYKTGDLGYFDAAGRLHLHGRKNNIIALANGLKVFPEDVEHALLKDGRLRDAVVLGLAQRQDVDVHAVLLLEKDSGDPAGIVRAANTQLAPHQQIRSYTVWPDETLPLTPTLKPKRAEVLERLRQIQAEHSERRES